MAGDSAREAARRMRAKADRLAMAADLYERGAEGERATADALAALPSEQWTVFHDLRWPVRRYANVDHVVVGSPGVFVIDSKNWVGAVSVRDGVLRQDGRARAKAVAGAREAARAVARLTRAIEPRQVHPVLCLVQQESVTGWAGEVMVCSTDKVTTMLQTRQPVLSYEQRRRVCAGLVASTRPQPVGARRVRAATPAGAGRVASLAAKLVPVGLVLTGFLVLTTTDAAQRFGEAFVSIFEADVDAPADETKRKQKDQDRQER